MNPFEHPKGIRLEVDGEWYEPGDLAWIEWAPCGCLSAVSTLHGGKYTVEAAVAQFRDGMSAEYAAWEEKLGFRVELVTFEYYKTLPFSPECPHTPKWGKPIPPTPIDREWRVKGGDFASKKARWHLFPKKGEGVTWMRTPAISACGKQEDYGSFAGDRFTQHLHCAACSEIAHAEVPSQESALAIEVA